MGTARSACRLHLSITRNLKDFPPKTLAQWDIWPKSPDNFVRDVMDFDAQAPPGT